MKLAWLVMLHHKPRQFARLFDVLHNDGDVFLFHVDTKATAATREAVAAIVAGRRNVHFLPARPVTWGGWSNVAVLLDALRTLLALDGGWRHFVNLSGQDYPLRPVDAIRAELAAQPDRNHVETQPIDAQPDRAHLRRRLRFMRFERDGRIVGTPIPRIRFDGIRVRWKGSAWVTLTRDFCEWAIHDPRAHACVKALRHSYIPDEFLAQTLAMNGPFAGTLSGDNRREILWDGGPHPLTLTMRHRDRLLASPAHFARKFDEDVDAAILDLLAERVGAAGGRRSYA